ncbi:MAG: acyl-ACP--UDP-N-acetylglucosamine O-acyltransferase [Candidatus Omnitrophica bacterium]|nr:acyl-ACP--UDP-N-acetylglucosamine O-acyltransferase [Candidatus Omnitrophota bacterium]
MPTIHATAVVDPQAELAADVAIGPYAIVGPHVAIGAGTTVGPHAILDGWTTIGARCRISPGAVVGAPSQDLKATAGHHGVSLGDDNQIREYVTISCGTHDGSVTRIGSGNLVMAYAHIAHDCLVGDRCIIANAGTLAGHVVLEDQATIGGLAAVHQFVRIGRLAIVGGCSKVVQDVVPFALCDGHPARVHGVNVIGLRRAGVPPASRRLLQRAFRLLFGEGLSRPHAVARLRALDGTSTELQALATFVNGSKRGLCRSGASD